MEHPEFHGAEDTGMQRHVKEVRDSLVEVQTRHARGEGDPEGMGSREFEWLNDAIKDLLLDGEKVLQLSEEEFLQMQGIIRELVGAQSDVEVPEERIQILAGLIDRYKKVKASEAGH